MVNLLAIRIEVPHLVHRVGQEFCVVTDHNEPTFIVAQILSQPPNGIRIEVIRWFIEKQDVRSTEKNPR